MSTDGQPDPGEIAANRARGQMLAQIPLHLGYQPGPTDVILMARLASSRTTEFIHARWDEAALDPTHAADDCINKLRAALGDRSGPVEPVMIGAITYGEEHEAARRLHAIITAAEGTISNLDSVTGFQIDGDQRWRIMTADITGDWWAMPGLPIDPLVAGIAAPAATRAEYLARFEPADRPSYERVSAVRARTYDVASPAIRAESAIRALDRLVERTADPRDEPMLAHYLRDPDIAHAVIAHSTDDISRADALVGLYRGAPEQLRASTAAAAAASMWLNGGSDAANVILKHVPLDRSHADQLARSVRRNIVRGSRPEIVAQEVQNSASARIAAAESAWHDSRHRAPGRNDVRLRDHQERLASIRAGLSEPLRDTERADLAAAAHSIHRDGTTGPDVRP